MLLGFRLASYQRLAPLSLLISTKRTELSGCGGCLVLSCPEADMTGKTQPRGP